MWGGGRYNEVFISGIGSQYSKLITETWEYFVVF